MEIDQVRILTVRGSVAYFLPEQEDGSDIHWRSADTVINGEIVELKSISGSRATVGTEFKKGYKQGASLLQRCSINQGHSVFIRLFSDISLGT
jgi:hypothetical protein